MEQTKIIYETGATTHATNDLILFTDNTRELAKLRDSIYEFHAMPLVNVKTIEAGKFQKLYVAAVNAYKKEFPDTDSRYFLPIGSDMANEYCKLFADDFNNWKLDHSIK